jgi:hypothetical protein
MVNSQNSNPFMQHDLIAEPILELGDTIRVTRHLLKEQPDFWERFLARTP